MDATRARLFASGLLLLALAVGCSSNDGLSLPTTESSTTTTTQPPQTTEAVTTTETTVETVETKPDLEIPTEWDSDLDEIFGRYLLHWDAEQIALGPPEADPDYPPLRQLLADKPYEEVRERIQGYRDFGVVSVVPPDSIDQHFVRLPNPAVVAKDEGREVIIQDCWIQDTEQQDLSGSVTQTVQQSILFNVTMRVEGDEWRVAAVTPASEQSSGYQECTDYLEYLDSPPPCPRCWPYGQES